MQTSTMLSPGDELSRRRTPGLQSVGRGDGAASLCDGDDVEGLGVPALHATPRQILCPLLSETKSTQHASG